jgi:hypothetical protein
MCNSLSAKASQQTATASLGCAISHHSARLLFLYGNDEQMQDFEKKNT